MLVSICIPAYEYPFLLKRCLASIDSQTYNNYEVIITDDSSRDELRKVVSEFNNKRFFYYKNEKSLGSPANWNKGLSFAKGDLIKIMHHDDWFTHENSLQLFVQPFLNDKTLNFAFSAFINTYETKQKIIRLKNRIFQKIQQDKSLILLYNFIGAPSTTIFRNAFDKNILFDEQTKWYVDVLFYVKILQHNTNFLYIDEPLVSITSESNTQVTNNLLGITKVNEAIYTYNSFKLLESKKILIVISLVEHFKRYKVKAITELDLFNLNNTEIEKIRLAFFLSKIPIHYKFYSVVRHILIKLF
jgi:glycosyltransferase involved in cell wall biosynthesis